MLRMRSAKSGDNFEVEGSDRDAGAAVLQTRRWRCWARGWSWRCYRAARSQHCRWFDHMSDEELRAFVVGSARAEYSHWKAKWTWKG
jgi:hypothetical protein